MSEDCGVVERGAVLCDIYIYIYTHTHESRDSSVGIATRYGLDITGIEYRGGGLDFPHPSRLAMGSTPASLTMGGSFLEVKRTGPDIDHPPHLSQRLKKE